MRGMKSAMLTSLEERFANNEEIDFLVLGTLLDPRFKYISFSSAEFRQKAVGILKSQYTSELEDCQIEEPPSKRVATDTEALGSSSVWSCLTTFN